MLQMAFSDWMAIAARRRRTCVLIFVESATGRDFAYSEYEILQYETRDYLVLEYQVLEVLGYAHFHRRTPYGGDLECPICPSQV